MTLPARIVLVDRSEPLTQAWRQAFQSHSVVEVRDGDFFSEDADAMVSPANSFGIMDGGLDAAIRDQLGWEVEATVQRRIVDRRHGELPVGGAEIVVTGHSRWPFLIVAPTMRIPENVAQSLHAYLAFRAALLAVADHNQQSGQAAIRSMIVPGLATGIGGMDPRRCAAQMRIAFDLVSKPARIPSFALIHELHRRLKMSL